MGNCDICKPNEYDVAFVYRLRSGKYVFSLEKLLKVRLAAWVVVLVDSVVKKKEGRKKERNKERRKERKKE